MQILRGGIKFLLENSLLLVLGAISGLIWANNNHPAYEHALHFELMRSNFIGALGHDGHRVISLHYLVNDILMAFFFALAGKEVWEAMLPGGPLNNPKKAATPLIATIGGMAGPATLYVVGSVLIGRFNDLSSGWAIPCATDIAFSYMVARLVFGKGHPAIPFLLLLAIADDAGGLVILAVFYPQEPVQFAWMLLPVAAICLGLLFHKVWRLQSFWWYILIPGVISWIGFAKAGLHPALGLIPVIPTLPHAHSDLGLFASEEEGRHDPLSEFEHWWKTPVELILFAFALMNAGVVFSSIGSPTWLVLIALLAGKPLGIFLCGMLSAKGLKFGFPEGMTTKDLIVVGCAAGIGFTVALFVSTVAFQPGGVQDAAKMGALFSFLAVVPTIVMAKVLGIKRVE